MAANLPTTNLCVDVIQGLTARQEAFARAYAEGASATDAYVAAFEHTSSRGAARVSAYRLLRNAKVAARVRELQEAAAGRSTRSTAALIHDLEEMVDVDPNELVSLAVGSCRHCWGNGGAYQWRDEAELARAVARYQASLETPRPLLVPDSSGGTGYRHDREPNPACNQCDGGGLPRVKFSSTADVSPGARRLLRGIELFPDGSVKRVLLHDQSALRIELHKLRGLHIDRSVSLNLNADIKPLKRGMSVAEALAIMETIAPTSDNRVVSEQ